MTRGDSMTNPAEESGQLEKLGREVETIKSEGAELRSAIATLSDGKWNKRDLTAVVTIFGALSGLVSGAALILQGLGVL